MTQTSIPKQIESEPSDLQSLTQLAHAVLRIVLAIRYRKNLVAVILTTAALLGGLYYFTAPRIYSSKASLLVSQAGRNSLDTSLTGDEVSRQSNMPTFENMLRSTKVLEGALKNLNSDDRVDLAGMPQELTVSGLSNNLFAKTIRNTSIIEVEYRSKSPQAAKNVVEAIIQSYLDFMDQMRKGTAGEISRVLTQERGKLAEKLNTKQEELLIARKNFADMGFRSEGKTLHPMVQRAVYFNDALIAAQKERVELDALLATIQNAVTNKEDLGQYVLSVGDAVGREMLLNTLGLGNREAYTQDNLEQNLLQAKAELQTAQQNLGPAHPQVVALTERIQLIQQYLDSAQQRIGQRLAGNHNNQLGPWLLQMVRQKLDESRKKEEILQDHFEKTRTEAINLSGQLAQIELLERDVKRLSDMNDVLLNQIASLDLKQNGQDVRVAVIAEPKLPEGPMSPKLSIVGAVTLFLGFFLALGVVSLLDCLDDRFRSVDEMQSRLGIPLLTMIQQMHMEATSGLNALVTHLLPTSVQSECFRTLRTAITLTYPDAHRLIITSSEPGDGKTTTLANLAVCYAQGEKRTLVIDADLRRPGMTALMEMRGPRGLSEVLRAETDIVEMAPLHVRPSGIKGLDIMPSGSRPTDPAELLGSPRLEQLLAWAESVYDLILIDSPPILATTDTAIVGRLIDGVILVVQPAKNRRRLVMRVTERLGLMKIPLLGMVVNRTGSGEEEGYYGYHSYGYGYEYNASTGYGHEADIDAAEAPDAEECVPFEEKAEPDVDAARAMVVPRRVA